MVEDFLRAKIDKTEQRIRELLKEMDELKAPMLKNEAVIRHDPDWAKRRLDRSSELRQEADRLMAEMRHLVEERCQVTRSS